MKHLDGNIPVRAEAPEPDDPWVYVYSAFGGLIAGPCRRSEVVKAARGAPHEPLDVDALLEAATRGIPEH